MREDVGGRGGGNEGCGDGIAGSIVPSPAGYVPPYVRAVIAEAAAATLVPLSRARPPRATDGEEAGRIPLLIAVMRDEARRLPGFLAHYRALGVRRFAIIDHGSCDGTRERLAAEADVDLYTVDRPFQGKQGWINALIAREGYGRWYLQVDADERLVFDGMEEGRGLTDLVRFAEDRGLTRLRGMLVDLYPAGPLLEPAEGDAPLFDADGYVETLCLERISRKGGPRRRAFGLAETDRPGADPGGLETETAIFDPELTKYPLFRIEAGEVAASPHHLHPYDGNYRSDCLLGLLHDKFGPGFRAHALRAAAERNYWAESLEYRRLLAQLATDPRLRLAHPGSRRYRSPTDLLEAGLITPIAWPDRARAPQGSWAGQLGGFSASCGALGPSPGPRASHGRGPRPAGARRVGG